MRVGRGGGRRFYMSKPFSHENVWSLRGRGPQEVLYCGQMIDIPLVTSLRQKERWGKRRQQSIQTLQRGAQKRGDALSNSQQQGPKERHLKVRLSCFSLSLSLAEKFSFSRRQLFAGKDVQRSFFILRSVMPTRSRFLVEFT